MFVYKSTHDALKVKYQKLLGEKDQKLVRLERQLKEQREVYERLLQLRDAEVAKGVELALALAAQSRQIDSLQAELSGLRLLRTEITNLLAMDVK